jgi:uncharacterized membrane protein
MKHDPDQDIRERKRTRFTQPASKSKLPAIAWALVGAGLVAIVVLAVLMRGRGGEQVAQASDLPVSDGAVRLPVSTFDDGKARWYTYPANSVNVQFFVLKSSDGVIRAAFNACDVCYPGKKGYRQEGDEMVCNNCGQRFPSVLINEVRGGCNPSPLARTIEGDEAVIRIDDILAGAKYFQ